MATSDQQLTKKLAEMKSFLERRISQQEEELNSFRSFLDVVDSLLAERSFRKVEITAPVEAPAQTKVLPKATLDNIPIMTTDGTRIASLLINQADLHIIPEPDMKLDPNSPPLRAFLISKVLEPMQAKDKEAAASGAISPDSILAYRLEQEDDHLKAIHIQNYGDNRRLLELKNAIRWTLRRMYEKTGGRK